MVKYEAGSYNGILFSCDLTVIAILPKADELNLVTGPQLWELRVQLIVYSQKEQLHGLGILLELSLEVQPRGSGGGSTYANFSLYVNNVLSWISTA